VATPLRIALGDLAYLNPDNLQNLYVPLNIGYLASTLTLEAFA